MNPNLYPGGDPKTQELANRIDKNSNNKVDVQELQSFLEAQDVKPDQSDLLKILNSKENELRKIDGLEEAVSKLALKIISAEDLKKPLPLSATQEAIVLVYEGLYGGKSTKKAASSQAVSETTPEDENGTWAIDSPVIENLGEKAPALTPEMRDRYTLKRSISNVSGLPQWYVANLDELLLSQVDNVTSAKLTLYMNEQGVLVSKEVKENENNNDNQTIIKFEKKPDNSWELAQEKDPETQDKAMIRLQDGTQIVRLPQNDNSVSDKRVSFVNGKLSLTDYMPSLAPKDALDEKLGNAALETLLPMIDKNDKGAYYYARVATRDGKFLWPKSGNTQIVLFDIYGTPIKGQVIKSVGDIKDKKNIPGYFTTTDNPQEKYATNSTESAYKEYIKDNSAKIIKGVFDKVIYDDITEKEKWEAKLNLVIDKSSPELNNILVDYVAQEGKIHLGTLTENNVFDSKLTLLKENLENGKELPIFLKTAPDTGGYYIVKLNKETVTLSRDIEREKEISKLRSGYDNFLERTAGRATYGSLDEKISISQPIPVENMEDKVFDYEGKKRPLTDIVFAVNVGMDEASSQADNTKRSGIINPNPAILTASVKLAGNTVQGFTPPEKWENDLFYQAKEGDKDKTIIIETPTGLLEYKVGVKQKGGQRNIHFQPINLDPTQDESVTKTLISQYQDNKGNKLFGEDGQEFTRLENSKGEIQGYAVETNATSGKAYTAFDMKGNIIGKDKLLGLVSKDNKIDLKDSVFDTSYQVVNKNERLIGLTNKGEQKKNHEQLVLESPLKIQKAITNGGFSLVGEVNKVQITSDMPVEGFFAKIRKDDSEYTVNFTLEGEVNSHLWIYEANAPSKVLQGEIINNTLFITDANTLLSEKEKAEQAELRKKLVEWYPRDGIVRVLKDEKVYEINAQASTRFAHEQLAEHGNIDAQKKDQYTKNLEKINNDHVYKDAVLESYADMPFYERLRDLSNNPAYFTETNIRKIIDQSKEESLKELEKTRTTPEENKRLEQAVKDFIKTPGNFDNYPVEASMEITSNRVSSTTDSTSESSPDTTTSNDKPSSTQSSNDKPSSTPKSSSDKPSSTPKSSTETKKAPETKETLPNFTWVGRRETPPPMTFNFQSLDQKNHKVVAKNQFDLKTANTNRSSEFKALLSAVQQIDASYSPKLKALQELIVANKNNPKTLVWKVQNWAADYAGIGEKVADWRLSDSKLGINTYTALLTALYITKSSSTNKTVTDQWNNFKQYFNRDVEQGASIARAWSNNDYSDIA